MIWIVIASLTPQGLNEYRYEVVSPDSADHQRDDSHSRSETSFSAPRTSTRSVGQEQKVPRIVELLAEVRKDSSGSVDPETEST